MSEGVFVWVEDDGFWPPRVKCVILAVTKEEAVAKAEDFAGLQGIGEPEYGEVMELMEHSMIDDLYKT